MRATVPFTRHRPSSRRAWHVAATRCAQRSHSRRAAPRRSAHRFGEASPASTETGTRLSRWEGCVPRRRGPSLWHPRPMAVRAAVGDQGLIPMGGGSSSRSPRGPREILQQPSPWSSKSFSSLVVGRKPHENGTSTGVERIGKNGAMPGSGTHRGFPEGWVPGSSSVFYQDRAKDQASDMQLFWGILLVWPIGVSSG
jgi:hypothetical protein